MRILVVLLIISILGNFFGVFVLCKYFEKDKTLKAVTAKLEGKDRLLDRINRRLPQRLVFVHHSVGRNWLSEGDLKDSLIARGIAVRSVTYGSRLGEETDMCHWLPKFRDSLQGIIRFDAPPDQAYAGPEENDIIMFKSCFPNSDVVAEGEGEGDPVSPTRTLANYRALMKQLQPIFAEHPDKTFVYVTAPPLAEERTTPENANRAWQFNEWVSGEFIEAYHRETGERNLLVFNLFDILAEPESHFLKKEYQRRPGDSHPNAVGSKAATKAFMAFIDAHDLGRSDQGE